MNISSGCCSGQTCSTNPWPGTVEALEVRRQWLRVSRSLPCPICKKPDWCLISGDQTAAICARVESGKRCGEAGWLHRLREDRWQPRRCTVRPVAVTTPKAAQDFTPLVEAYEKAVDRNCLSRLAQSLGVAVQSLLALGIGWSTPHHAWSFPMRDAANHIIGIHLRQWSGRKFAVPGSRNGLFLPRAISPSGSRLLIAEGCSDTAALLTLGFNEAVGRPSCSSGTNLLLGLVCQYRPQQAILVADNDQPGRRGADELASALRAYVPLICIISPPPDLKDVRSWLQRGATAADINQAIRAASPCEASAFQAAVNARAGLLNTANGRRFFSKTVRVNL
jgi:hypothetical protein